jgi:hypothetical protein
VEVTSPPRITTAIGCSISCPERSPPKTIGSNALVQKRLLWSVFGLLKPIRRGAVEPLRAACTGLREPEIELLSRKNFPAHIAVEPASRGSLSASGGRDFTIDGVLLDLHARQLSIFRAKLDRNLTSPLEKT